jgi:murein DD-endopeptidase MepM/ murein hydrolase activator NlpD
VRQRNVSSTPKRINALRWLAAAVSLAVSFILSLSPLVLAPVAAAPPETIHELTESSDSASDSGTKTETPQVPDAQDQFVLDIVRRDRAEGDDRSVRLRGVEAPVQLEKREGQGADQRQENDTSAEKPENVEQDPGDGPVPKRQEPAKKQKPDRAQRDIRIWPMPARSYTFTQQFGCVPQLGSLYFPGEGCPANRPVIHTGVDLAAPEGTPFYAAASGWVTLADYDRPTADANTRIIIQHDGRNEGYATDYLHWVASYVEEGDYVHAGDPIGEVGNVGFSTGPHLHFSVTDLDTGEHIDPLRWLPDEPGLEGYVSRMPKARLRLPAGTTAGQPESADPAPPEPAVKEDVPESPPEKAAKRGKRGAQKREERGAATGADSTTNDATRSGKKRSRDEAASGTNADKSTGDTPPDRARSRETERTRARNKDGSGVEDAAPGDNGGPDDSQDGSSTGDRRGNRKGSQDSSGGVQEDPKDGPGKRTPRDTEPPDASGPDEQGGRHDHNADRQNPDQGEPNGGGNDGNGDRRRQNQRAVVSLR